MHRSFSPSRRPALLLIEASRPPRALLSRGRGATPSGPKYASNLPPLRVALHPLPVFPPPPSSPTSTSTTPPLPPQEKAKIQNDIQVLSRRLAQINEALARKIASRNEYDKVIQETEAAYLKILESSQTLLTVLKRESVNMTRRKQASA